MFSTFFLSEQYNLHLTRGIDKKFGFYHVNGTIIEIDLYSSASKSRMMVGDEIVGVNGNNVSGHDNIQRMMLDISKNKTVNLTILHYPGKILCFQPNVTKFIYNLKSLNKKGSIEI